ncbi:MAG TPA: HIT domain-containing protein [Chitinispirillaceae bacterium]|nr:HIT domain-containing protein [Chitinispirillaceae bacterium]
MDRLWAPWRMKYIQEISKKEDGCIFCTKPKQSDDKSNLILHRGKNCFVIMNLFPYNNGHLMVVPHMHTSDPLTLDKESSSELWDLLCLCKKVLTEAIHPDAFNIGMNIGRVAGAGIDQHIHMHIVPRWNGDTNFMPVLGDTRVISQGISDSYDALLPFFKSLQ